ncbi:hypothetical protein J6590_063593 [Homalodisca vitripennis]|nr:hypothetical protein J6590_063593 [Homalodisca vitripennis]
MVPRHLDHKRGISGFSAATLCKLDEEVFSLFHQVHYWLYYYVLDTIPKHGGAKYNTTSRRQSTVRLGSVCHEEVSEANTASATVEEQITSVRGQ